MSDLSSFNPIERFTGLANLYAQYRPGYPSDALDFIISHCNLNPNSLLVDVGCGTGISSFCFSAQSIPVIALEPNKDMLTQAQETLRSLLSKSSYKLPVFKEGYAEATGLPKGIADVVLAAQAFHWFKTDKALAEFHRILKPAGWVVLMWNERNAHDEFTAAYSALISALPHASSIEVPRSQAGNILLENSQFQQAEKVVFSNKQLLDEDGLLGRSFSASYAPKESTGAELFTSSLRKLFNYYQKNGIVTLQYQTLVYVACSKP